MTIGVAIIGLGFMGRTHLGAYRAAGDACRLVGVADRDPGRLRGEVSEGGNLDTGSSPVERLFDPEAVFATDSIDALLSRRDVDAVSVCTPTETHAEIARAAIQAGKHVLIEKPVSLDRGEIESLATDADRAGVVAMPAMCMRFWPEWAWLAGRVGSGDAVASLSLERLGTVPSWGGGFYDDPTRSGGAMYDLHIHDTDFVCHLLGRPDAVTATGSRSRMTTIYAYDNGPDHVVASGGWLRGGADFRMRYVAELESGTADFDLLREPTLKLSNVGAASEPAAVHLEDGSAYDAEVGAFLESIARGGPPPVCLADASLTLAVLEAEVASLTSGRRVRIPSQ